MKQRASLQFIQRMRNGYRCERLGCCELADWYVASGDSAYHWCSAHTKALMRNSRFWRVNARVN